MPQAKKPELLTEELGRLIQVSGLYKDILSLFCVDVPGHYFDAFGVEQKELMESAVCEFLEKQKAISYSSLVSDSQDNEYGSRFMAASFDGHPNNIELLRDMKQGLENIAIPLHNQDTKQKNIETINGIVVVNPSNVKVNVGAASYAGSSPNPVNLLKSALEAVTEAKRKSDGIYMIDVN